MTTPTNGAVPDQFLIGIGLGLTAEKNAGLAFTRLFQAHPEVHTNGIASAYWSRQIDTEIHTKTDAMRKKYNISIAEQNNLAPLGASPHLLGTRLNFSGISEATAAQFGFRAFNSYTFDYTGEPSWITDTLTINPASIAGNQRVARVKINGRSGRNTKGVILNEWAAGAIGTFKGYVHGQTVTIAPYTSDIWLVGQDDGLYYSLAGATWNSTDGMADLDPNTAVASDTPPATPSEPAPSDHTPPGSPAPTNPIRPAAPSTPAPPKAEPIVSKPTPVIDPDLEKLDPALTTLTTTALPYIPKAARATVYTVGVLIGVVAAAVGPVFGGEVAIILDAVTKAALAVTGALALSNVK